MEELLNELQESADGANAVKKPAYSSFFFQPERLLLSSEQAEENINPSGNLLDTAFFNQFTVNLPRPALEVKSLQLVRANIPNAVTNIPNEELTFWYYRIPFAAMSLNTNVLLPQYLKYVRLLPSYYKPELNTEGLTYGYNRTFESYQDLASELAKSCLADPIYDSDPNLTPFRPGDISITFDERQNKFIFTGNGNDMFEETQFYYISAGYSDPNLIQNGQFDMPILEVVSENEDDFGIGIYPGQPFRQGKTLNLRLGFTWSGIATTLSSAQFGVNIVYSFRFRPVVPLFTKVGGGLGAVNFDSNSYTAESYANLVYTNCVNVYVDLVTGASVDTDQNTSLLAAVPMNASNLGVGFYNPVISNPLTKILNQIYSIQITLRTDTGAEFYLPNSATVSMEIAFTY